MAYQSEIEKLEQRYRENPQQWFAALADSYRKAGSLDLAIDVVRAGLDKRPNYVSGHIVHGRCLIDQQKDGEAKDVFEQVLQLDAENVIAIKALAEISQRTGQTEGVRRWVGRLLEVDPMNEEAQEMMARLAEAEPTAAAAPAAAPAPEDSRTALSAAGALLAGAPEPEVAVGSDEAEILPAAVAPAESEMHGEAFVVEQSGEAEVGQGISELPTVELERAGGEALVVEPGQAQDAIGSEEQAEVPAGDSDSTLAADLEPFDSSLAWGTGERVSRQISAADIERARHAHEASLHEVVQALPGLEQAEVPGAVDEGVRAAPPMESVTGAAGSEVSGADSLPMIYPEDAAPAGTPEPEPVVTETMAELYAGQGLVDEARATYRKLLAQRPGDPVLQERLAALEAPHPRAPRRALTASATGGSSVRDFLSDVFAGRPSRGAVAPTADVMPVVDVAVPAGPPPRAEEPPPSEPTILEAAFEESSGPGPTGEPTRRASDEVSLAAVFGEEPPPPKATDPAAGRPSSGKPFSFDEFFGTPRPSRESSPSSADDDDFKRWLKSLKS